jgi:hypothetical protein
VILSTLTARRGALLLGILGALAFALTLYLFYPGFMSRDSANQLAQARSGAFTDHHPVLMALVWRLLDRIVPGPGGMLILQSGIYWAGLTGIFWAMQGPLYARALGLLVVGSLLPPFCCGAGIWKDSLMHSVMLAAIGCFLVPLQRSRWPRYLLGAVLLAAAIGLRHNGAAAVWPLLLLLLVELRWLAAKPPWTRLALAGLASLALTFVATVSLNRALAPLVRAEHFWQRAAAFDLAALSLRTGELVIEPDTGLLAPGVGLPQLRGQFRPDFSDTLYNCGEVSGDGCVVLFTVVRDQRQLSNLARNWIRAIVSHPGAWLAHKTDMAGRLLRLGGLEPKRRYFYIEHGPFHFGQGADAISDRTMRILQWLDLQQTWVGFSAWIYVLLSCLLLPLTLVRYARGGSLVPVVFILSGLSYLLSVVLTAGGPDNRYTVWTILCTMLALASLVMPSVPALASLRARLFRRAAGVQRGAGVE